FMLGSGSPTFDFDRLGKDLNSFSDCVFFWVPNLPFAFVFVLRFWLLRPLDGFFLEFILCNLEQRYDLNLYCDVYLAHYIGYDPCFRELFQYRFDENCQWNRKNHTRNAPQEAPEHKDNKNGYRIDRKCFSHKNRFKNTSE